MSKKAPKERKKKTAAKPRKKLPKQQTLPDASFKQVRSKQLDDICHNLTEIRESEATNRADRASNHAAAAKVMTQKGIFTYTANGSTVIRTPGQDKISSREAKGDPETIDEEGGGEGGDVEAGTE